MKVTPLRAIAAVIGLLIVARCTYAVIAPKDTAANPAREPTAAPQTLSDAPMATTTLGDMLAMKHVLVMYDGARRAPQTITRSKEQAKVRAETALAKLKLGATFESVVTEYTDDPRGAKLGGDLGTFSRGSLPAEMENALAPLAVGEMSGVVESPFGFHVILRAAPTRGISAEECTKLGGELFERIDTNTGANRSECKPKKADQPSADAPTLDQSPIIPASPALDPIERASGISRNFAAKYVKRRAERFDIPGANRLNVRVSVPTGLSRADLESNVRHALLTYYENASVKLGAVDVLAYASEKVDGAYTAAKGTFAPNGQWSEADKGVAVERWRVTLEYEESYFAPKSALGVGSQTALVSEGGSAISISRSASSWNDADILARLSPGTKVRILGEQNFGAIRRYEVEALGAVRARGWVHTYAVKSP